MPPLVHMQDAHTQAAEKIDFSCTVVICALLRAVYMKVKGGAQLGEVTCGRLPHLSCKRYHIKMGDYRQAGYPT